MTSNVMNKLRYLDKKVRPPNDQSYDDKSVADHGLTWEIYNIGDAERIKIEMRGVDDCVFFLYPLERIVK